MKPFTPPPVRAGLALRLAVAATLAAPVVAYLIAAVMAGLKN